MYNNMLFKTAVFDHLYHSRCFEKAVKLNDKKCVMFEEVLRLR